MKVTLRLVDPESRDDVRHLFNLLNERKPWQSISHKQMPTFDEHDAFVKSDPYRVWYLIEVNGGVAGCVYLTDEREIGISIYEKMKGKGVGSEAVRLMMDMYDGPIYANINPLNDASREFFTKMGFVPLQVTYVYE